MDFKHFSDKQNFVFTFKSKRFSVTEKMTSFRVTLAVMVIDGIVDKARSDLRKTHALTQI